MAGSALFLAPACDRVDARLEGGHDGWVGGCRRSVMPGHDGWVRDANHKGGHDG